GLRPLYNTQARSRQIHASRAYRWRFGLRTGSHAKIWYLSKMSNSVLNAVRNSLDRPFYLRLVTSLSVEDYIHALVQPRSTEHARQEVNGNSKDVFVILFSSPTPAD
ncbi:unnamed protein product, partial [Ectocarpus sp. 13 AM-2016]